ncbi:hypothetical protein BZA05DRAFT_32059 [Tricharina praecox]|uniref:uncharacterized protein n=1 Tax=Tricharina praecox TaxID=43433 RepID=UPI0022210710|nr:uncharacterized protein BZA05DRAFT_32059 [Tricharina praecox]KAI5853524.1 hypothetical protein BZA05DRAFT_32059 [Tricharina praecox]
MLIHPSPIARTLDRLLPRLTSPSTCGEKVHSPQGQGREGRDAGGGGGGGGAQILRAGTGRHRHRLHRCLYLSPGQYKTYLYIRHSRMGPSLSSLPAFERWRLVSTLSRPMAAGAFHYIARLLWYCCELRAIARSSLQMGVDDSTTTRRVLACLLACTCRVRFALPWCWLMGKIYRITTMKIVHICPRGGAVRPVVRVLCAVWERKHQSDALGWGWGLSGTAGRIMKLPTSFTTHRNRGDMPDTEEEELLNYLTTMMIVLRGEWR